MKFGFIADCGTDSEVGINEKICVGYKGKFAFSTLINILQLILDAPLVSHFFFLPIGSRLC